MNKKLIFSGLILLFLFGFNSCSYEEIEKVPVNNEKPGFLSFGSLLNDLANRRESIKAVNNDFSIPNCSENNPISVSVSLKKQNENGEWEWYKNSGEEKINIDVHSQGYDIDGDEVLDAWFTQESQDLELQAGVYRLEYFAVKDANEEIIFMAPRKPEEEINENANIQYHNYVNAPLPLDIEIREGVKYYQPVEVLCYEEHLAFAFGYLFFDFIKNDLFYLCTFGNICSDGLQHMPAHFKMKVWAGNSDQGDLLVTAKNEVNSFDNESGTHYYSEALCFPLPEMEGYYAKIWLIENEGTPQLIRKGSFDAITLQNIYREEQEHYYYHFRESCCEEEDNYYLLDDLTNNEGECEDEPQDPPEDCGVCEGKISKLTFKYTGADETQIVVEQKAGGNNDNIEIFNQELNQGDEFSIVGEYSQNQNQPNSLWTEIYITEGEGGNQPIKIHTSCSDPNIVPGYSTGNFEIISGESTGGGFLCPVDQ